MEVFYIKTEDVRNYDISRIKHTILAEASPKDTVWGIGLDAVTAAETSPSDWPGQNLLGKILMELRAEFAGKAEMRISEIVHSPRFDEINRLLRDGFCLSTKPHTPR